MLKFYRVTWKEVEILLRLYEIIFKCSQFIIIVRASATCSYPVVKLGTGIQISLLNSKDYSTDVCVCVCLMLLLFLLVDYIC